jgi:hypothetical protein
MLDQGRSLDAPKPGFRPWKLKSSSNSDVRSAVPKIDLTKKPSSRFKKKWRLSDLLVGYCPEFLASTART